MTDTTSAPTIDIVTDVVRQYGEGLTAPYVQMISDQTRMINQLHDTVVQLQQQLALERGHTLFGMALPGAESAKPEEFARINALCAGMVTVERSYQQHTESRALAPPGAFELFRSQKPPVTNPSVAAVKLMLTQWLQSFFGWATIQHEPDNPSKQMTPASFDALLNVLFDAADESADVSLKRDVTVGPVLMAYQVAKQGASYAYGEGADLQRADWFGFDCYAFNGEPLADLLEPCQALMDRYGVPDMPITIPEFGVQPHTHAGKPIDRPQWVHDQLAWCSDNNVIVACYFNMAGTHDWTLTDDELHELGGLGF